MIDENFVKEKIAAFLKVPAGDLEDGTVLSSLIADSFMVVELMIELEEACAVRLGQEDVKHVKTLGDLISVVTVRSQRHGVERLPAAVAASTEES